MSIACVSAKQRETMNPTRQVRPGLFGLVRLAVDGRDAEAALSQPCPLSRNLLGRPQPCPRYKNILRGVVIGQAFISLDAHAYTINGRFDPDSSGSSDSLSMHERVKTREKGEKTNTRQRKTAQTATSTPNGRFDPDSSGSSDSLSMDEMQKQPCPSPVPYLKIC